jgi:hypothetical protein
MPALTRFTALRSLKLEIVSLLPPSASDILQLRALHQLRHVCLQSAQAWVELTNGVLCELLLLWPQLAKLELRVPTRLSNRIVPAIGVKCPNLSELELHANRDSRCFDTYIDNTPVLPHLTRLVVRRPILLPGSTSYVPPDFPLSSPLFLPQAHQSFGFLSVSSEHTATLRAAGQMGGRFSADRHGACRWTSRKHNAEAKRMAEVIAVHAPRLVERSSTMEFTYSSRFAWSVVGSLCWLGIKAEKCAA